LLVSANDVADTFAARTASSRRAFVAAMNQRARQLQLRDTHYGNPVGLDVPRTFSSARDLTALTRVAMREPRFSGVVGLSAATLMSGSKDRRVKNRNELVGRYGFVDGVKTGHTDHAGWVLVGAAHKEKAEVIAVAMGEPNPDARNRDVLKMLRYGRAHFGVVRPIDTRRALANLPVWLSDQPAVVYPASSTSLALRDRARYSVVLEAADQLEGPIAAGSRVGTAIVNVDGKAVGRTAVIVRDAIPAPTAAAQLTHLLGRVVWVLLLIGIVFMICFAVWFGLTKRRVGTGEADGLEGAEKLDPTATTT